MDQANPSLSNDGAPATLAIDAIQRDKKYQLRTKTYPDKVEEYARQMSEGGNFPPISVADIRGRLVCTDGFHRLAAYEKCGVKTVQAIVRKRSHRQALRDALSANQKHGIPFSRADYKNQFRTFMREGLNIKPDGSWMSYAEITAALGNVRRRATIHNWMKEHFPSKARAMGRDGIEHYDGPTTIENIDALEARRRMEHVDRLISELVETVEHLESEDRLGVGHRLSNLVEHLKNPTGSRAEPLHLRRPLPAVDPDEPSDF